MAHQQMTFYLLQCIQYNTNKNQQRCTTKELGELQLLTPKIPANAGMMATRAKEK